MSTKLFTCMLKTNLPLFSSSQGHFLCLQRSHGENLMSKMTGIFFYMYCHQKFKFDMNDHETSSETGSFCIVSAEAVFGIDIRRLETRKASFIFHWKIYFNMAKNEPPVSKEFLYFNCYLACRQYFVPVNWSCIDGKIYYEISTHSKQVTK